MRQKKQVSYEQAFRATATNISKPLPQIIKWVDNERYLETRRDTSGKMKTFAVNAKNGEAVLYDNIITEALKRDDTPPKDAKNFTWSPDGKWAAYTLNNNLYIRNGETGKDIQLTSDGSETIKNGYASWVYFEEILGRGSRYRAFWWSPDSKKICFMRFDDTKVPTFPIFVLKDQHGYLENEHYPKAGDPNPEVKIGVADISTQKVAWADFNEKEDQYFGQILWTPENKLWVQWMNRGQDNLKIYNVDLSNGQKLKSMMKNNLPG